MSFQVYMNEKINCKEARNLPEDLIIKIVEKSAWSVCPTFPRPSGWSSV